MASIQYYQQGFDNYYFRVFSDDGVILLQSEFFPSQDICNMAVSALIEAINSPASYVMTKTIDSKYSFYLLSQKGAVLAHGQKFESKAERSRAVNNLIILRLQDPASKNQQLSVSGFVKAKRRELGLSQEGLSQKAGVGLRFLRELEQGKNSLRIDKINQVLNLFGYEVGPVPLDRQKLMNENSKNKNA